MSTLLAIARYFRRVHLGGNWTCVKLHDTMKGVNWQLATPRVRYVLGNAQ